MSISLASLLLALSVAPQEFRTDEHRIATIPEGISLEGAPRIDPNGKEWPVVYPVIYGPQGARVAYVGLLEGETHPVIDEEVLDAYDYLSRPRFDSSGSNVVFRAGEKKTKTKETWWVLINGEEFGKADWIGEPSISPDGTRIAYWTQPGAKIGRDGAYERSDQVLVVATKKGKKWKTKKGGKWDDALSLVPPTFSADGSRVTTVAQDKNEWIVIQVTNKEKEVSEGEIMISDLTMSTEGDAMAYTVFHWEPGKVDSRGTAPAGFMSRSKNVVHWKGQKLGADFDSAFSPVLTPDGRFLAYKAVKGEEMGVVVGVIPILTETFEYVHAPIISNDGQRVAFVATEGGEVDDFYRRSAYGDRMIQGGESFLVTQRPEGDLLVLDKGARWLEVRDAVFSADGEHLAYAARSKDGWTVVIDEEPGPFADDVGPPRFSPDEKHVAHGARAGRELWWRVRELGATAEK